MAYFFRLPKFTDLTIEQRAVLNELNAIAVSGGPGTGKSVVALWRHIQNHDMGKKKSLLLTYTVSLETYLASSAKSENQTAGENVSRTYWWLTHNASNDYDEIIVDEAQDVAKNNYERLKGLTPMLSYSADDNQILYPNNATTERELIEIFNNPLYTLRANYRNTIELGRFVKAMFPDTMISEGSTRGPKPKLVLRNEKSPDQVQIVKEVIETFQEENHNITVLVPLKDDVHRWHKLLVDLGLICSKYVNGQNELKVIENIHVTTYKSCKGLEFDTVIIPNFNKFEEYLKRLYVVEPNDFYVVFTRTRRNLILIDNDNATGGTTSIPFIADLVRNDIVELDKTYLLDDLKVENQSSVDDLPF